MNDAVLHQTAWQVYTNDAIYQNFAMDTPRWCWVAYGPRGSQSGAERKADDATHKAMCAAEVLADPMRQKAKV